MVGDSGRRALVFVILHTDGLADSVAALSNGVIYRGVPGVDEGEVD